MTLQSFSVILRTVVTGETSKLMPAAFHSGDSSLSPEP